MAQANEDARVEGGANRKKSADEQSLSMIMSRSASMDDTPTSEQPNTALSEPDALNLVLGDMAPAAVNYTRKEQLLQQARADRRKWIQNVPLPFVSSSQQGGAAGDPNNVWMLDDRLAHVQSTPTCSHYFPTATKVLSELYGMEDGIRTPEDVASRIESLIGPLSGEEQSILDTPSYNYTTTTNNNSSVNPSDAEEAVVLQAYKEFWNTLLQPECALLVQGMRSFLRTLGGSSMEGMATSLKSYLVKTYDSLKSHVAWKDCTMDDDSVRRSLESFVYGQSKPLLDILPWDGQLFTMTETEWTERLTQLQFVQPSNLEIECLQRDGGIDHLDELLQQPIEMLLSVDRYYSPYEKLQRILKMYQGVNAALSKALNYQQQQQQQQQSGGDSSSSSTKERKLPSADDVLPTIILTVLRAQPVHMFRNLQLVEAFCPPEYLRGEAGYAYTNLYGAVQFLQDLDMDHPSSTLAISPEDFQKGLEACRANTRTRISAVTEATNKVPEPTPKNVDLSVQDVRTARLRGELVDVQWALQWQQHHPPSEQTTGMASTAEEQDDEDDTTAEVELPPGFTRSYSYLTCRPEDIRLSDLPNLLAEYRMLAHTTERLLGERTARFQSKKRRQKSQRKQLLHDRMMQAEDDSTTTGGGGGGAATTSRERVYTS